MKINNAILKASHAVDKSTGEEIKLSSSIKLIYSYLLENYKLHQKENKSYKENWLTLGLMFNVSESVTKRTTKDLKKIGLLEVKGRKNASKVLHDIENIKGWVFVNRDIDYVYDPEKHQQQEVVKPVTKEKDVSSFKYISGRLECMVESNTDGSFAVHVPVYAGDSSIFVYHPIKKKWRPSYSAVEYNCVSLDHFINTILKNNANLIDPRR